MTGLPETRADWLMTVIVRLIRPDIVSALRQVEAQARAEAEDAAIAAALDWFTAAPAYRTKVNLVAAIRAAIGQKVEG